jgi:hypothetical protein
MGGLFGVICGCNADVYENVELEPRALFIVGIQATTAAVLP